MIHKREQNTPAVIWFHSLGHFMTSSLQVETEVQGDTTLGAAQMCGCPHSCSNSDCRAESCVLLA
jgi:hypothetical protein